MPKLSDILNAKSAFIEADQAVLEKLILKLGNQFANDFSRIVASGVFDIGVIFDALDTLGYSNALIERLRLESFTIQRILDYSKQASQAQGINFVLTATNEAQLFAYLEAAQAKVLASFRAEIAADLVKFAFEAKLSQKPFKQITARAESQFAEVSRRASTEVGTAMTIFDRATMSAVYDNAGIDRFYYFPPTLIKTSRESCRKAISDPRQETGWTRDDINNEPDLDFVLGGAPYYNCRHEFISFNAKGGLS